ncbi:hypothetical protein BD770DRAFT_386211 [Pilaira anomala]|nr:hypothetical protein BD770DRAFT_386211 [Pilaira anomala]
MKLLALILNVIFAFELVLAAEIRRRGGDIFEFVIGENVRIKTHVDYFEFDINKEDAQIRKDEFDIRQDEFDIRQNEFDIRQNEFDIRQNEFDIRQNEFDIRQNEFDIRQNEFVTVTEDVQIRTRGQNCGFTRKDGVILTKAICQEGLTCIGVGPSEYKNNAGGAHSTNFDHYVGVCIYMKDIESV